MNTMTGGNMQAEDEQASSISQSRSTEHVSVQQSQHLQSSETFMPKTGHPPFNTPSPDQSVGLMRMPHVGQDLSGVMAHSAPGSQLRPSGSGVAGQFGAVPSLSCSASSGVSMEANSSVCFQNNSQSGLLDARGPGGMGHSNLKPQTVHGPGNVVPRAGPMPNISSDGTTWPSQIHSQSRPGLAPNIGAGNSIRYEGGASRMVTPEGVPRGVAPPSLMEPRGVAPPSDSNTMLPHRSSSLLGPGPRAGNPSTVLRPDGIQRGVDNAVVRGSSGMGPASNVRPHPVTLSNAGQHGESIQNVSGNASLHGSGASVRPGNPTLGGGATGNAGVRPMSHEADVVQAAMRGGGSVMARSNRPPGPNATSSVQRSGGPKMAENNGSSTAPRAGTTTTVGTRMVRPGGGTLHRSSFDPTGEKNVPSASSLSTSVPPRPIPPPSGFRPRGPPPSAPLRHSLAAGQNRNTMQTTTSLSSASTAPSSEKSVHSTPSSGTSSASNIQTSTVASASHAVSQPVSTSGNPVLSSSARMPRNLFKCN